LEQIEENPLSKSKIAIVTDSTAYIPEDMRQKYDIRVIPLTVNWGGKSYLDNVDISPEAFYSRLEKEKEIPTTSQPSAGAFKELFESLVCEYDAILAVLLSSDLSGTVASAQAATEMLDAIPIRVVDSRLTTMALGLLVIFAAQKAEDGASLDEVVASLDPIIQGMRVYFVVDTLEFLHRGGRIGGAQRLIGSMLAMKPVLQLVEGKIDSLASVRTKKKAIQSMLSVFEEDAADKDLIHLTVFHGVAAEEAEIIRSYLEDKYHPKTLVLSKLSPVLGVHTGPGTVGIAYYFE
jgi:DegV family protein with EDD domain